MRRKDVIRLIKRVIAIILVAVMTASVLTSYDRAGQFFNSVKTVFADEIEGEGEDDNSFIIDTEAPDTLETEPSYNEDCIDSDIFEDTTGSSESEPAEDEPENTGTFETDSTNEDIGLIQREVKAEGEDIFVSGLLPSDAKVTAERVEVEVSGVKVIAAYDIKVFDKNGNEWQPVEPLKISVESDEVNKASEDETQVIYVPDDLAESGKPVDIKDTNLEKIDAVVKDGNVEFEAEHFSVYVIIEHMGGEVVTPRVQFHFIAPVAEGYQPTNNNGVFEYTSDPYTFNNKATDHQATNKQVSMIVRDGDKLESIEAPMNTQNTYFYGWYVVDMESDNVTFNSSTGTYSGTITYSWPLDDPGRVELDKTASVSAVRSGSTITAINWTVGNASGTSTDIDSEGCAHVYLAPIYSNYYFVNFHLGARSETTAETLLSRKLIVLGNSNQTEVKVSDVEAPSNDPVHVVFIGWEENTGTEQNPEWTLIRTIDSHNQEIVDPGKDGKYITVGAKTVDLYPFFVQARYINFNIGPSGNGALFLGPQLIFTSDEAQSDEYALTTLPTTTRSGYTFGGWYTGPDGTGHQITDGSGNIIDYPDDYVVYGSYMGNNSVAYKISDGKLYAYDALDEVEFYANWISNTNATYKVVIWKQRVTDSVNAVVKTYDYETYYYDDEWNTANTVTDAVLSNFSGKDSDSNSVTGRNLLNLSFEGFEYDRNDNTGTVDPQGSTVINVYYNRKSYTFTFQDHPYTATTSNNGTQYGLVENQYVQLYYRNNRWRLTNNNNGTVYNGTRYTRNDNTWVDVRTITALSGQDISSEFPIHGNNGAIYQYGERWMPVQPNDFYDQVIVVISSIPNGNVTFQLNTSSNSTKTMYFYVEVLPGETPETTVDGIGYKQYCNPINANYGFFTYNEDFLELEGYVRDHSDPAFTNGQINANTAKFYYTRERNDLIFSANYPHIYKVNEPQDQVFSNIPYEQRLASYSGTAAPEAPSSDYVFAGWYEDASGTVPFDFANETMPSAPKIIYAHWTLVEYPINVNPNGGVIDHIEYTWFTSAQLDAMGLDSSEWNGYATYFDNLATQTIESYDNLERNYVEVSDAEAAQMDPNDVYRYVYIYRSNQEGGQGKLGADARNAVYIRDTEASLSAFYDYYVYQVGLRQGRDPELTALPRAQWEATYVSTEKYRELRSGEQYVFLAWYEVVNGVRQNTPYDFSQPADHETSLIAEWRLDGGYSILYTTEYYADNNDYITANLEDWTDPLDGTSKYADGATTQAMQEPTSVMVNGKGPQDAEYIDYQFLGWQIVKVETVAGRPRYTPLEPGVYYTAGQDLTIKARYSDANMVIHMQAVYQRRDEAYRRPEVVNLTLNAGKDAMNTAYGTLDSSVGALPDWTWPGHYYLDSDNKSIIFGDTQSNTAVYLYKYATTLSEDETNGDPLDPPGRKYFKHPAGYLLIGFDLDAYDNDFVPQYAADSVVAVTPGENHTLYAVWEPMVYLDLVNNTEQPLTISLSTTSSNALYVVNQADGSFSRTPVDPNGFTIQPGTTRLVMPYGAGKDFTVSGTNTLGYGYVMKVTSTYAGRSSEFDPAEVTDIKNTKTYSITDQLYEDTQGRAVTVTFSCQRMPRTLVLHDNDTIDSTWETSFDIDEPTYNLTETRVRVGRVFKGWDENANATTATYPIDSNGLMNQTLVLNDLFGADTEKHLFAVWGSNDQEGVVKVYKEVPLPGNQNKEFTFNVRLQGQYRRYSINSYTSIDQNEDFTLSNGQYLIISIERNTGGSGNRATLRVAVQKYNADGTKNGSVVYVGWQNTNNNSYNDVRLTQVTVIETVDNDYVPNTEIVGIYDSNFPIESATDNEIYWTQDRTGGTVVFTNTRKTADVTINKQLLPATVDPENFTFTATVIPPVGETSTYTLSPDTMTIVSGTDTVNGGEWKIEGIPTGSTLTITEVLSTEDIDLNRFVTTAVGTKSDNSPVTDRSDVDTIFQFLVEDDTTVTFKNTLRTQNIRLVVVDDDVPFNYLDSANFTFPGVFEGTKFSAAGTGLVWEGTVNVGEYTLTETSMPDHAGVRYTKLQAPVTVAVAGGARVNDVNRVTATTNDAADTVTVTYDNATDTYIITVVNPKMLRVTVRKTVLEDYGIGTFGFTVTLTDSNDDPIQMSNVYGTQGTNAQGKLEFTLVNNQTALLYVPRNANLHISETVDENYDTVFQTGADADHLSTAAVGTSTTLTGITSDKYVLCTNVRQKVNVTVEKTVIGNGATFTFNIQVKDNDVPVANYTLNNNGTPDDVSDDIVTDSSGIATFTLTPATNGTADKVFTIHKGMKVNVTEVKNTTVEYEVNYTITDSNGTSSPVRENSTGFVTVKGNTTITFTNKEASIVAPTDVKDGSMIMMIMMSSSAICFAGAVVHNKRKRKGGRN